MKKNNEKGNSRFIVQENDEGPHENEKYLMREWWYYNAFFNHKKSELRNWSIILSLSRNLHTDGVKILLHNDKNTNYGKTYLQQKGCLKTKGSGANIDLHNSFIRGFYPKWDVHFENIGMDKREIVSDLKYKATKKPVWLFNNTGHNKSTSIFGYYFVVNCEVKGTISIDNKKYNVKGIGYYDHTWSPLFKKSSKKMDLEEKKFKMDAYVWDWIYIHLNNGWNVFIGKVYFSKRGIITVLMPGSLNFVLDDNNLINSYFFPVIYKDFQNTSVPDFKAPREINIRTMKINLLNKNKIKGPLYLDLTYKTDNINEFIYGEDKKWGIWDSSGKVTGKLKSFGKEIKLEGFGIMEHTSNI